MGGALVVMGLTPFQEHNAEVVHDCCAVGTLPMDLDSHSLVFVSLHGDLSYRRHEANRVCGTRRPLIVTLNLGGSILRHTYAESVGIEPTRVLPRTGLANRLLAIRVLSNVNLTAQILRYLHQS